MPSAGVRDQESKAPNLHDLHTKTHTAPLGFMSNKTRGKLTEDSSQAEADGEMEGDQACHQLQTSVHLMLTIRHQRDNARLLQVLEVAFINSISHHRNTH